MIEDQGSDEHCRRLLKRWNRMAIDVERECDIGMSEPLAHDLRVHAGLERERRVSVAEVVEADSRKP